MLVLGFEPFAGDTINPSAEIANQLAGETIEAHRIVSGVLPVSFSDAPLVLAELLDRHKPTLVVALGQAGGRAAAVEKRQPGAAIQGVAVAFRVMTAA